MTKITDKQHDQLTRIGHLYARRRAVKSEVMADIDQLIQERTDRINEQLFEVVREAVNDGVPKRRIGMAIGTTASVTWDRLIEDALGAPEVETVDVDDDKPHVSVESPDPHTRIVKLDNYLLDGDVVHGEVEFQKIDEDWFVQGDTPLDFAVERAIFGTTTDDRLNVQFFSPEVKS